MGGIIGTVILPGVGTILGGLLGGVVGHAVEDAGLRSELEAKIDGCKAKGKMTHIYYMCTG